MSDTGDGFINIDQGIDDAEIMTLTDILQSEEEIMDNVRAVLGGSDDKNCTYDEGYLKRQALYACLTCIPEAKTDASKCAGVCLACSFHCHDGHELIELYTKRNFRCDCGNSKFTKQRCNLNDNKDYLNEENVYSQNFWGLYCVCSRPYPDPEDTVVDEMIQCVVCEDWFHSRHLGTDLPPMSSYTEVTCEACIKKHDFLLHYDGLCVTKVSPEFVSVDMSGDSIDDLKVNGNEMVKLEPNSPNAVPDAASSAAEKMDFASNENSGNIAEINGSAVNLCTMPKAKSDSFKTKFWKDVTWREQLCTCENCLQVYENQKVSFLIDLQDTVLAYEEKGKSKVQESEQKQFEEGVRYLNSLDRVPLMVAIDGYNELKENLTEYLRKFAENKKVVREEDIKEFFSTMDARKKLKTDVQHFCR